MKPRLKYSLFFIVGNAVNPKKAFPLPVRREDVFHLTLTLSKVYQIKSGQIMSTAQIKQNCMSVIREYSSVRWLFEWYSDIHIPKRRLSPFQ